ncbi:uncharacterized protein LOC131215114 [Anopheles bellator]|uniref:uncharacterized protein LOC131215114 n=1 Tax=Anopheles bellator TaxID=139047 RepID=UPI0026489AF6|nr:uncharacterized protein LOC131215114 [Anopheles bellator]
MKPSRPPPPPKPARAGGVPPRNDFRDSGISVTDEQMKVVPVTPPALLPKPKPSAVSDASIGVRQLASRFESISVRQSSPPPDPRASPPRRPVGGRNGSQNHRPLIAPKPLYLGPNPSMADRALLAQRANEIAERIYDTVCERDPSETVGKGGSDPSSPDGYSSFESSSNEEEEELEKGIHQVYSVNPLPPTLEEPAYDQEECRSSPEPAQYSPPQSHLRKIINELLEKERKYIETLDHGIRNYIPAMYSQTLPAALRGQKNIIFINLEEILATHRDHFYADLERAASTSTDEDVVERIAQIFLDYIERDRFYCYVTFAMHQPESELLVMRYSDYFLKIQQDLNDHLGLNSLLLQPIQRLPRYKLLLNEMVKDQLKEKDSKRTMNRRTALLCKVDKRIGNFIDRVNQAINLRDIRQCRSHAPALALMSALTPASDAPLAMILQPEGNRNPDRDIPVNLLYQGHFQRMFLLDIYDTNVRRKYSGKLFAFEKLLLYVEILRDRMEYRGHYFDSELCHTEDGRNRIVLSVGSKGTQDIMVQSDTNTEIQSLLALLHSMTRAVIYDTVDATQNRAQQHEEDHGSDGDQDEDDFTSVYGTAAEDENDACDELQLTMTLVQAQQQFLKVLVANQQFYLDPLSVELKVKLMVFINAFDAILNLHHQILTDLSQSPSIGPNEICQCFLRYLKTELFAPYFDYLREFQKAVKWIPICQTPSNFHNRVAATVQQFTFLCIEHLQEYNRYFETLIVKYSDDSSRNLPLDTELFQQLAFAQVRLNAFRVNLSQTYKLYLLNEKIPAYGPLIYDDRAMLSCRPTRPDDTGPCRMFICKRATICVKVEDNSDPTKDPERFVRIVFIDRFPGSRGTQMRLRQSKRHSPRLNFLRDGLKFRIEFNSKENKNRFYDRHVRQYAL